MRSTTVGSGSRPGAAVRVSRVAGPWAAGAFGVCPAGARARSSKAVSIGVSLPAGGPAGGQGDAQLAGPVEQQGPGLPVRKRLDEAVPGQGGVRQIEEQ